MEKSPLRDMWQKWNIPIRIVITTCIIAKMKAEMRITIVEESPSDFPKPDFLKS